MDKGKMISRKEAKESQRRKGKDAAFEFYLSLAIAGEILQFAITSIVALMPLSVMASHGGFKSS